jgi:hypothetical protein
MTKDEIIEIAKQAGLTSVDKKSPYLRDCLERFAKLVAAKSTEEANAKANASWTLMCKKMVSIEREACAKVADNRLLLEASKKERDAYNLACKNIAAEIKARGEQA